MSSTLPSSCLPICDPSPSPSLSSFLFIFLHVEPNQSDDAGSVSMMSVASAAGSSVVESSAGMSVVTASVVVTNRVYSSISFSNSRVFSVSDGSYDLVFVNRLYSFQFSSAGPTSLTSRLSWSAFSSVNGGTAGAARQLCAANKADTTKIVKHCKTYHRIIIIMMSEFIIIL